MTAPLQGIRIVDLSAVFSGPMATALLGDQGAEVIKVESPEGDTTRSAVSATLAWQVGPNAQFDIGAGFGLTADSPRTLISIGFARRI